MNIILISECDKRALTETRRILDQFAERRGARTWQTAITLEGVNTLRRLLRKTARKNTAVACHWVRGLDHTELLWVVGNPRRFNSKGAVPTNTTARDILRKSDENDWHTGEDIHLLTALAALLHDLGKASQAFQSRLLGKLTDRNQYRHEWVSLRLFQAFVGQDDDATWLSRLIAPTESDDASWLDPARLIRDGLDQSLSRPFEALRHAPLAQAIGWLVVTHHRLPSLPANEEFQVGWLQDIVLRIDARWNETPTSDQASIIAAYWSFPHGLPVTTHDWRRRAARIAKGLQKLIAVPGKGAWLQNPYVMHLSRLSLMLADHYYSSLEGNHPDRIQVASGYPLFANTLRGGAMNQALDEHLVGVARHSADVTHALPRFEDHLPRLGRHRKLCQHAQDERFRWQDKAFEMAAAMRTRSVSQGAFIVNMASTGCGKTLANARIMHALADPAKGMRCAFALGLRTLTLQTGRSFRDLLGLGDDELAIRVGGSASRELQEFHARQAEATGSASRQALMEQEEGGVDFIDGNEDAHPLLRRVMHDRAIRRLLAAPLLVCTIDHLMPATESQRGGRQIAPMLRLMSGDLVLDEPDDFDIDDLPALTRLVHWAGMLGARVLLSSATLPPALIQGLFMAYQNGRQHYAANRGQRPNETSHLPAVCCAWVDEFHQMQSDCATPALFEQEHAKFVQRRHQELGRMTQQRPRCRVTLVALPLHGLPREGLTERFAKVVMHSVAELHQRHHSVDPHSGKRISFGLVRMANIEPLYEAALALYKCGAPAGLRIHLCVYHSQFPLLLRSDIEQRLDTVLNRQDPTAVFRHPDIRHRLDTGPETDQIFIVLGSPVTEVGRDHDYDWAVVEPSSMRSLIQLAGRVKRHRRDAVCEMPNIHVFETNLKAFTGRADEPAFWRPGFESRECMLADHNLSRLLDPAEYEFLDARPRIVSTDAQQLRPGTRFVDLEHARMRRQMLPATQAAPALLRGARQRGSVQAGKPLLNAATWWSQPPADALLTSVLQHEQRFREDATPRVDVVLMPTPDEDGYELQQLFQTAHGREAQFVTVENARNHCVEDGDVCGERIQPWGQTDYLQALLTLAEALDMAPQECARRYGTVTLPASDQGWRFHPALGFSKARTK